MLKEFVQMFSTINQNIIFFTSDCENKTGSVSKL